MRRFRSLARKEPMSSHISAASDVWYFLFSFTGENPPSSHPTEDQPRMRKKPTNATWVACRLCSKTKPLQLWRCQNGQTDTIRDHMRVHHDPEWHQEVVANQLKGWESLAFQGSGAQDLDDDDDAGPAEPFSTYALSRRIVRWIAADDQAINVVESPFFREIIRFASTSPHVLTDKDILHRTHAHDLIVKEYGLEIKRLREELKNNALGRISFTCDLWSSQDLRGYFALSVHYCKRDSQERLTISSRLGAFRNIAGRHTGTNLAEEFVAVLEELNILHKPGCVTVDNASNCGTMMEEIARLLTARGIPFHREGNRLRCFPHVVNISVRHGLSALTALLEPSETMTGPPTSAGPGLRESSTTPAAAIPIDPVLLQMDAELLDTPSADTNRALQADSAYAQALLNDPVDKARRLVSVCRSSGQRRADLRSTIIEGNEAQQFGTGIELPKAQLLRDVETRWSSTFLMIDRLLELYPAVDAFLRKPAYETESNNLLSPKELDLLSAEQTPTASMVLPAYEELLELLGLARLKYPKIGHAIDASKSVLEQYMRYTRQNRVYALAMIINPSVKLSWLEKHWDPEEVRAAKAWITDAMLAYRRREREPDLDSEMATRAGTSSLSNRRAIQAPQHTQSTTTVTVPHQPSSSSHPSRAQHSGFASLQQLRRELSSSSVTASSSSDDELDGNPESGSVPQQESDEDREARLKAEDLKAVEQELQRYVEKGQSSRDVNLLDFWDTHSTAFPYLFHVALDVLPVQASSVASERVFSSSKETDTLRRSGLDGAMMEILQVLKYSIHQEWRERPYASLAPPPKPSQDVDLQRDEAVDPAKAGELVHSGRLDEFLQLVHQAHGDTV
ncbi:hypothetical protein NUW54_g7561 [Trametes sanguinea]|uniref:Uncharacterized protein n=1 Tax=Trametes sanguinea TaxID=158606 RepID=A0ACC1PL81_9APHY|nr:hypothetical protein NUW54_g7561 [Trametes sanguinea]